MDYKNYTTKSGELPHVGSSFEIPPEYEDLRLPPQVDRIVVFGTNIGGAAGLTAQLREALTEQGVAEDVRVDYLRDAAYITHCFYDVRPEELGSPSEVVTPIPVEHLKMSGRGLISWFKKKFGQTKAAAPRSEPVVETDKFVGKTRPRGVIIFPEMRSYDMSGMARNVTFNSYGEHIVALCEQNKVPYVLADFEDDGGVELRQAVVAMFDKEPTAE